MSDAFECVAFRSTNTVIGVHRGGVSLFFLCSVHEREKMILSNLCHPLQRATLARVCTQALACNALLWVTACNSRVRLHLRRRLEADVWIEMRTAEDEEKARESSLTSS